MSFRGAVADAAGSEPCLAQNGEAKSIKLGVKNTIKLKSLHIGRCDTFLAVVPATCHRLLPYFHGNDSEKTNRAHDNPSVRARTQQAFNAYLLALHPLQALRGIARQNLEAIGAVMEGFMAKIESVHPLLSKDAVRKQVIHMKC